MTLAAAHDHREGALPEDVRDTFSDLIVGFGDVKVANSIKIVENSLPRAK